jgi:hypothetical protein
MSLYKNYATDPNKESNGAEVPFEANEDGTIPTFIVSRIGDTNKEYMKSLRAATKPFQRQIDTGTLPADKDAAIFMEVFVSSILKGWSNVQDENGVNLPFTKSNAEKLFSDLPDVFKELQKQASTAALFRKTVLEDQAKN